MEKQCSVRGDYSLETGGDRVNRSFLISLVAAAVVTACTHVPPAQVTSVRHAEDRLHTGGEYLDFQYHVLSEDRHASALKFEGYLLAFEKSNRELIGFESPWLSCSFGSTYERRREIFKESGLKYKSELIDNYPAWVNFACKRLDDRARVFLSHAVKFEFEETPIRHLSPSILFSVYPTNHQGEAAPAGILSCNDLPSTSTPDGSRCKGTDKIYQAGWDYLSNVLPVELGTKLASGQYTHVIVASMGWNTHELETIQNYNSLIGNLLDAARPDRFKVAHSDDFRPLFIGLAWPSAWTFRTGRVAALIRGMSVINKGYDADELGMTWYGQLVHVALRQAIAQASLKSTRRPTVVTIGHSYGARALSYAVAACPFFGDLTVGQCQAAPIADIVIGLEAAYNRSRFLAPSADGSYPDGTLDLYIYRDGSPLQRYDVLLGHGTRHFYIWSTYDDATSRFNLIGGADNVCSYAKTHSDTFALVPCTQTVAAVYVGKRRNDVPSEGEVLALEACKTASNYMDLVGPCQVSSGPVKPPRFITTSDRVLLIDGSGIARNETPLHGGGAHSDIYKWEIGNIIWQIIRDNSRKQ